MNEIEIRAEVEKIVLHRDRLAPDNVLVGDIIALCLRLQPKSTAPAQVEGLATSRPWKRSCFLIQGPKGDWVAHTGMGNLPPSRSHESEANAALIVTAVNAYEGSTAKVAALTAALSYVIRNAVANGARWAPDIDQWACDQRHTLPQDVSGEELVRAALALIESPTKEKD